MSDDTKRFLTLKIDLDQLETVEGEGKFEGYTFLNSVKGRFTAIEALDADGNQFSLKTVFIRPAKAPKAKSKGADSKTQQADVMAQMLDMMKSLKADNEAMKAQVAAVTKLKAGRNGVAGPGIQSTIGDHLAAKTNGVAKV